MAANIVSKGHGGESPAECDARIHFLFTATLTANLVDLFLNCSLQVVLVLFLVCTVTNIIL